MPCTICVVPRLGSPYAVGSQRVLEPGEGEEYGAAWVVVQQMARQAGAEPSRGERDGVLEQMSPSSLLSLQHSAATGEYRANRATTDSVG